MQTRRDRRWWKERWVADHYAELRSPQILAGYMEHKSMSRAELARLVTYERVRESGKGVSRQMISYLVAGGLRRCEPDLAAAIERVLDVPAHAIFAVLPKSPQTRETDKTEARIAV